MRHSRQGLESKMAFTYVLVTVVTHLERIFLNSTKYICEKMIG